MKATRTHTATLAALVTLGMGVTRLAAREGGPPSAKMPSASAAGPAAPLGVAVCDVVHAFGQYQRAVDETRKLDQVGKRLKQEAAKRQEAIERAKVRLEGVKDDGKRREALAEEVKKLETDCKAWLEREKARCLRYHHRLSGEMYEEVLAVIGQVARERGLGLVLQTRRKKIDSTDSADLVRKIHAWTVLYAAPEIDITDEVLRRLNSAYRKRKGTGRKPGPEHDPKRGKERPDDL